MERRWPGISPRSGTSCWTRAKSRIPDLPRGNLVSALIELETNRDRGRLPDLLGSLIELLRQHGDEELTAAFRAWVAQALLPPRFRGADPGQLPRLEEVRTMLAEQVQEWTEEWVEEGREQGIAERRAQERALLCRLAERKFYADTGALARGRPGRRRRSAPLGAGRGLDHRVRHRGRPARPHPRRRCH